jgi:Domain of unknown function (DUF4349)
MRIIPFPPRRDDATTSFDAHGGPAADWLLELDEALAGRANGAEAERWRTLQADVRALAPPLDPQLERALRERLDTRRERSGRRLRAPISLRPALALAVALLLCVPIVLVIARGGGQGRTGSSSGQLAQPAIARAPSVAAASAGHAAPAELSPTVATAPPAEQGRRLQQLAASIALRATPSEVQGLADRVSALAVGDGGFVARSQVQQSAGSGEAQLMLQIPSASLSRALAALARLAPVESQSRSLQDITSSFDAARRRQADAETERSALLRALARAQTQGEIESLHARLAQARRAIERGAGEAKAVSRRAAGAQVEVTVLGDRRVSGGGPSLHAGLRDADRVLAVTLTALAIAAAVLVPLGLVVLGLVTGRRAWLRRRRLQALTRDG